jgi:hypothetical protein
MTTLSKEINSIAADPTKPIGDKLKDILIKITDTHNNIRKAKAGSPGPTFEIGAFKMRLGGAGSTTADKLATIVTDALTQMSLNPEIHCLKNDHFLILNGIDKIIGRLNSLPRPSQPPQPSQPPSPKGPNR